MTKKRDITQAAFRQSLKRSGFRPLPHISDLAFHCTLEAGTDVTIHVPDKPTPSRRSILKSLKDYRHEIQITENIP